MNKKYTANVTIKINAPTSKVVGFGDSLILVLVERLLN